MMVLEGNGICSGPWDPEELAREREERRKHMEKDAAAEAWAAELRQRCAEIDLMAGKYMAPQLDRQKPVIKPIDKQRFRELQTFCAENDWPTNLPIMAHALCEYIAGESIHGYKHVVAIVKSISKTHEAAGEDACPTRDPLVKAYLELVRDDETQAHRNQKGLDNA